MEDIIKLDRLKLIDAENPTSAENFFLQVQMKTGAQVQWENGCKIAPYRKEPCIKLSGDIESVTQAKEMLLDRMEVQSNRVVMKMDVSHFEHSSLIGKSGKLIKKVMEVTGCHIHFPDGNKCPAFEKSNQVSISGTPINVEKARLMLRALIPVQVLFEIPSTSYCQSILDPCSPEVKKFEKLSGLLMYSFEGKNGTVVVLRCNQDKFLNLRKEIPLLMEVLCCRKGFTCRLTGVAVSETNFHLVDLPPVHVITDIMPQHQLFVKGNNNCNLEDIKKITGANISFPDIALARTNRNNILISGNLDCVYMAWQELMNYLPVTITFDVNYTRETNGEYMNFLQDCGVTAFSHPKPKYHVKNVSVRGPEKFSKQMLQYHQHLLRLPALVFSPDIEHTNLALKVISSTAEYFRSTYSPIPPSVANIILDQNKPAKVTDMQASRYYLENEVLTDTASYTLQNKNWSRNIPHNEDLTVDSSFSEIDYQQLKILAVKAMRRPINTQESTQIPSNLWAGYGFSQSMPASVIKDNLDSMNYYSYAPFDNSSGSSEDNETWENVLKDCVSENIWSNKREGIFSHSNYFDFLRESTFTSKPELADEILPELLWQHNLQNYSDVFIKEEVDYQTFLLLSDEDLQSLGIPFNARIKMLCLIRDLQEKTLRRESRTFNAAPGAERKLDKKVFSSSMSEAWK